MSSLLIMSKAEGFSVLENLLAITGQTLDAYEKCMERQSDSLSKAAQKMFCKTKYETKLSRTEFGTDKWTAGYRGSGESTRHAAYIINNSSDLIITRVEWVIKHKDNENNYGALLPETCESAKGNHDEPLWIEPNGGKDRVDCDVKFIPDDDRRSGSSEDKAWSWNVKNVYGLKLD